MMKKEISLLEANQYNSSKESRNYLMSLLSAEEQKIFKEFVKSVIGGWYCLISGEVCCMGKQRSRKKTDNSN